VIVIHFKKKKNCLQRSLIFGFLQQIARASFNPSSSLSTSNKITMVLYTLFLKADLSGVTSLKLKDGSDICLSVRNPVDHEEVRERIVVDSRALEEIDEGVDAHHSKHHPKPSHFSMKWSGASSPSTIRVIKGTSEMLASDSGTFVPILSLECDGLEPYGFHPLGREFVVQSDAGVEFKEVDLSSGDWSEYDIGAGTTSVLNLQAKFE
jgi:hypothetical protein